MMSKKNELKAFIIMPYGSREEYEKKSLESQHIATKVIRAGIERYGAKNNVKINILLQKDETLAGSITEKIIENIATSDIAIIDITGVNPNVLFELGVRFSLRKNVTILLAQAKTEIPFDLKDLKYITYHPFETDQAVENICNAIESGMDNRKKSDSLVYRVYPNLKVRIPGVSHNQDFGEDEMSWEIWWNQGLKLIKFLNQLKEDNGYRPDVIIGISNGGLMIADLIGTKVYRGFSIPILSLWSNRWQNVSKEKKLYFDNPYNDVLLKAIVQNATKNAISILLVDDVCRTSTTFFQAKDYLLQNRDDEKDFEILYVPLFIIQPDYLKNGETILPYGFRNGEFKIDKEAYFEMFKTKMKKFPWGKKIDLDDHTVNLDDYSK